jgi:hypothetical protein
MDDFKSASHKKEVLRAAMLIENTLGSRVDLMEARYTLLRTVTISK